MNFYKYDNDSREWNIVWNGKEYTFSYRTTNGGYFHCVKPPRKPKEPELQAGDSSALDSFLGGFANAKK